MFDLPFYEPYFTIRFKTTNKKNFYIICDNNSIGKSDNRSNQQIVRINHLLNEGSEIEPNNSEKSEG